VNTHSIKKIVIAGGGTAGWAAAAALAKQLGPLLNIVLIESDDIGTVGVGEASIPPMRAFHRLAGIEEQDFMCATSSTFKLGIQFENWGRLGDKYNHSFGRVGMGTWMAEFHHLYFHGRAMGIKDSLEEYCLELQAAKQGKFVTSDKPALNYAYHLDATAYATYLRTICVNRGVTRIEGKITAVNQDASTGFITSLELESGQTIQGDFFIDCTGFRGLLIEQTLKTGYEDWSHWLPTNRAIAVQTRSTKPPSPYTRAIARSAGWQWQIPLQHRVGNGLVYCSDFLSEEQAHNELLSQLEGDMLTEPRVIKYTTGRRKKFWNRNCLALGLSSGFLEPLESTSIYLVMIGITRFIQQFPFAGVTEAQETFYNATAVDEFERIRDFIVLHYKLTEREDAPFWEQCKHQEIPSTLAQRIALFREAGHIFPAEADLFRLDSWLQVMVGQGLAPRRYHHIARLMTEEQLRQSFTNLKASIKRSLQDMPSHEAFIHQYCPSETSIRDR
jgi:tryptophan halogenase